MKRVCPDTFTLPPTLATKQKLETEQGFNQVFNVAQAENRSSALSHAETRPGDCSPDLVEQCDEVRVSASSKVNFSKLSPAEQKQRFLNQAQEIKRLKRKIRKYSAQKGKKEDTILQKAVDKIKIARHEIDDQKYLIENLLKAINTGKLTPGSFSYCQICTILRDLLNLPCPESRHTITLPEKSIPISTVEYDVYKNLTCTPGVLRAMVGREQHGPEDPSELLRALHVQVFASMEKEMNTQGRTKEQYI